MSNFLTISSFILMLCVSDNVFGYSVLKSDTDFEALKSGVMPSAAESGDAVSQRALDKSSEGDGSGGGSGNSGNNKKLGELLGQVNQQVSSRTQTQARQAGTTSKSGYDFSSAFGGD